MKILTKVMEMMIMTTAKQNFKKANVFELFTLYTDLVPRLALNRYSLFFILFKYKKSQF